MAWLQLVTIILLQTFVLSLVDLGDLPMQNPDLFEGDIIGIEHHSERSAIVSEQKKWPQGIIPYELDPGLGRSAAITLEGAIGFYKRDTCIRFIPRTNEADYVRIFSGDGCYSHVGRTGGLQPLSLGVGCNWMGTIVHELGHAIGFYHEQNRSDRDDFLIIYWDNIKDGLDDQFFKLRPEQNQLLNDFDYNSIMLYGEYAFSKDRTKFLKTMAAKVQGIRLQEVRDKYRMSKSDIWRVNHLYNCQKT